MVVGDLRCRGDGRYRGDRIENIFHCDTLHLEVKYSLVVIRMQIIHVQRGALAMNTMGKNIQNIKFLGCAPVLQRMSTEVLA